LHGVVGTDVARPEGLDGLMTEAAKQFDPSL
jgi:hypothetical protein